MRKEKEIVIKLNEKRRKPLNFPVMQKPNSSKISFIVSWIIFYILFY